MTFTRIDHKNFQGIGSNRPTPGGSSYRVGGRLLDDQQLAAIYTDPYFRFARLIVDRPAEDCTREGWEIQVADSEDGNDPFADELSRLGARWKFQQAHKKARLYGGAAILMIVDDDGEISEPITGNVRGVKALHVFSRSELRVRTRQENIEAEDFGEPLTYSLTPKRSHTGQSARIVHADRVIPFIGLDVPKEFGDDYDGWGQSVIEAAYAVLCDADVATDSVREAIDAFQYSVLKLDGLSKVLTGADGDDNSAFQRRLDGIEEGKRRTRHVVIDADDDYQQTGAQFTGLIDSYQIVQQNLSAVTRFPVTILFGQSPGGLSTDDQSGTRNYYDGIRAEQTEKYEPGIVKLCGLLAEAGHGPAEGWSVFFHDLLSPSDAESAETKKTIAETDAVNIMNGVYTPEEARARYGVSGFQHDIVLDGGTEDDDDLTFEQMRSMMREVMGDNEPQGEEQTAAPGRANGEAPEAPGDEIP